MSAAEQMDSGVVHFSSLAVHSLGKFCMMFFLSSVIGVLFGLASSLVSFLKFHAFLDELNILTALTLIK